MISLLLPTRKRIKELSRMAQSARKTATNEIEIVAYVDDDDISSIPTCAIEKIKVVVGPRIRNITECWNKCFEKCTGDIVCQANDDIVFITRGWDVMVEEAFAEVDDRILLVHGNDVFGHGGNFGPHPFVHRKWVETLGYFIPPYFSSDFGDAWVNEIADMLGRRRFVPFDIEHHHFSLGLCEADQNTKDRLARHTEDNPDAIYYGPEKVAERQADAEKLSKLMTSKVENSKWVPHRTGVRSRGKCPKCGSLSTVFVMAKLACNGCSHVWDLP